MAYLNISTHIFVLLRDNFVYLVLAFFVTRAIKRRYLSHMRDIPALGFLHTISRLGKVREVLSGNTHIRQLEAHRKYGMLVVMYPKVDMAITKPRQDSKDWAQ